MRRLLTADFAGKEALARQLDRCRVRIIDTEGTLLLEPSRDADPAVVLKRIPVEAEATDEDGIRIHFLLHVVGGFIRELEVYKDDGSRIKRMPRPDELAVIVLPR
ncbi:MAG TPA: hypothetical protein VEJ47_10885 [Candidatus Eremiobacteraceae bacterium]|nr:hypothetical protein [Candidatus Eremiobacteraceae bacterium]